MLGAVDSAWKDHLLALDHLKEGIGLRGYAPKDPKNEYKRESYELFQEMKERVEDTILKTLFRLEPVTEEQLEEMRRRRARAAPPARTQPVQAPPAQFDPRVLAGAGAAPPRAAEPQKPATVVLDSPKVGRNDLCPCGSGKKFKKCHGARAASA
jgi:preprotein translocase subunit SecA